MMRKPLIAGIVTLAILATLAGAAAVAVAEIEETGPAGREGPPTRVLLKRTEPRSVATMHHIGPFDEIPGTMMRLVGMIAMEGYAMTGPMMVVYHDSPEDVPEEKLMWEVWMPVAHPGPMKAVEEDEMGFRYIDPMFVAYTYHIGPYDGLPGAYELLIEWAGRNEYKIVGPPVEVYWSDPMTVPAERLVTEIWFPIEEKKVPGIAK